MIPQKLDDLLRNAAAIARMPESDAPVRRVFRCERCGIELDRNVCICGRCYQAQKVERRGALLARAHASIPAKFRWARLGAPELTARIRGSVDVLHAAAAAVIGKTPIVTVTGISGSGKTSLACAMLAEVIDAGRRLDCNAKTLERAKHAFFVDAQQLALARKEHRLGSGAPDEVLRARRASVLVLDELGREDRQTLDVAKIIHEREAASMLTIVCTWLDQAGVKATYDGGTARRLFENAVLFQLGGGTKKP